MKKLLFLLIILGFLVLGVSAQNVETTSHTLNWTGVKTWTAGAASKLVIAFDGAVYPGANGVPYYSQIIPAKLGFTIKAEIKNPIFITVSDQEKQILQAVNLQKDPTVTVSVLQDGVTFLNDIQCSPFVSREGQLFKLKSFDLSITEAPISPKQKAQKVASNASNSVLSSGKFVKIRVANTGVYKLTYETLVKMGVDPAKVRIFGYGGNPLDQNLAKNNIDDLPEMSIYENKGGDGVFNAGDYILFYANGPIKKTFNVNDSIFRHLNNTYSKYGYYYVTSDAGVGKRMAVKPIPNVGTSPVDTIRRFLDYQLHEQDLFSLINGGSGKEFYGESLKANTTFNIPFLFPNVIDTMSAHVNLDLAINSQETSSVKLTVDGIQNYNTTVYANTIATNNYDVARRGTAFYPFLPKKDNFDFGINYSTAAVGSQGYLNFVEINAYRQLKMAGTVMPFQCVEYLNNGGFGKYILTNANSNIQIWDVTDCKNIQQLSTQLNGAELIFVDGDSDFTQYLAVDPTSPNSFTEPEQVEVTPNQNLHALSPSTFVIITHPMFLAQAQLLAQAHRDIDKMSVNVVTTDQIYNEFSSGTPDATSYRMFMRMLYDKAVNANDKVNMPKYLLLFGKGTYDNRKLIANSGYNYILTYQADESLNSSNSFVSDDYFGLLSDNEGVGDLISGYMEVGVGRFPVTTAQQATDVVNKTISYMKNKQLGIWKNQVCFVADDERVITFKDDADQIADDMVKSYPAVQVNKLYLDAFKLQNSASGGTYPMANTKLDNLLTSGLLMLNYTGHAGSNGWAAEKIMSSDDINVMTNKRLPVWMVAACDFSLFDHDITSGGESVLLNPLGGGIGCLACARLAYEEPNITLNNQFCSNLFKKIGGQNPRIGDVVRLSKNNAAINNVYKLSYVYFGDPAVSLNIPNNNQVITSKINGDSALVSDTLKALSVATVEGFVADTLGNIKSTFNGTINAVVYDKVQTVTMLNNHNEDYSKFPSSLQYLDRPNTLFSGKSQVVNGKFIITFMLPKDIKYNFGAGKILYYASDSTNNMEAQGNYQKIIIGGTDPNFNNYTTDGPNVSLYLNTPNFVEGGKVNETPVFYAKVSDVNGINTVGSGIGHDMTLCIDHSPEFTYTLNECFQSDLNSYTSGNVEFKIPEIAEGKHTLTYRVWNLINNSSTKTVDFEVVKGLAPIIFTVTNQPNPVINETKFVIVHDRPESVINTTIELFDVSGRKIWSHSQPTTDDITWNLSMTDGVYIQPGVYIYKVSISTPNSDVYSKSNKMIIVRQ
jgi:Peptidase family C25